MPESPLFLIRRNVCRTFRADAPGGVIGRHVQDESDAQVDISVDASGVSRQHARWQWLDDGTLVIEDTSSNGSWLNGKKLHRAAAPVKPGDELEFGSRGDPWIVADTQPRFTTHGNDILLFYVDGDVISLVFDASGNRSRPINNVWVEQLLTLAEAAFEDRDAGAEPRNRGWRTRRQIWELMGKDPDEFDPNLLSSHWYNAQSRIKKELSYSLLEHRDRETESGAWVREYRMRAPSGGIRLPRGREIPPAELG